MIASMTAVLLDGTATARQIKDELRAEIEALRGRGVRPGLGVVLAGDNPASAVYVRNKTRACDELGISHETALFAATTTTGSWCSSRFPRGWTPRASWRS